jgi:hypothetical protein
MEAVLQQKVTDKTCGYVPEIILDAIQATRKCRMIFMLSHKSENVENLLANLSSITTTDHGERMRNELITLTIYGVMPSLADTLQRSGCQTLNCRK